jgi:putative flippase GtrA
MTRTSIEMGWWSPTRSNCLVSSTRNSFTCIELVGVPSAGLASLVASMFGIAASFIGNRYFVFRSYTTGLRSQAARFVVLYTAIACLHAGLLFVWSDLWGLDYRIGFLLALAIQVVLGFWGNKSLVFAK